MRNSCDHTNTHTRTRTHTHTHTHTHTQHGTGVHTYTCVYTSNTTEVSRVHAFKISTSLAKSEQFFSICNHHHEWVGKVNFTLRVLPFANIALFESSVLKLDTHSETVVFIVYLDPILCCDSLAHSPDMPSLLVCVNARLVFSLVCRTESLHGATSNGPFSSGGQK